MGQPLSAFTRVEYLVKVLRPPAKYAIIVSSYGWAGGAVKAVAEAFGQLGIEVVGIVEANGPPSEEEFGRVADLARELAKRMA